VPPRLAPPPTESRQPLLRLPHASAPATSREKGGALPWRGRIVSPCVDASKQSRRRAWNLADLRLRGLMSEREWRRQGSSATAVAKEEAEMARGRRKRRGMGVGGGGRAWGGDGGARSDWDGEGPEPPENAVERWLCCKM
jgi:hypothetical protein